MTTGEETHAGFLGMGLDMSTDTFTDQKKARSLERALHTLELIGPG